MTKLSSNEEGGILKRLVIVLICMSLLFGTSAYGQTSEEACLHRYKLFAMSDRPGCYACMCLECEELFDVYHAEHMDDLRVIESEVCAHVFRKGEEAKKQTIEPVSLYSHEVAFWYDCTCAYCELSFEAYESDGRLEDHTYSKQEDVHVEGSYKHLYLGNCDVCGAIGYEFVNCYQYEDGMCMGGKSYTLPAVE